MGEASSAAIISGYRRELSSTLRILRGAMKQIEARDQRISELERIVEKQRRLLDERTD